MPERKVSKRGRKGEGGQPGNKNAQKWTEQSALALGEEMIQWMLAKPSNIYFKEFLVMHKGLYSTVINWLSDNYQSFFSLKKRAMEIQEIKLLKYAGAKGCHSTMAIFSLKNNHGYRDRQEISGDTDSPLHLKVVIEGGTMVRTKKTRENKSKAAAR